ncbi:MAG: hypothetical protein AAF772_07900 [Acidobacteriota bacterium]
MRPVFFSSVAPPSALIAHRTARRRVAMDGVTHPPARSGPVAGRAAPPVVYSLRLLDHPVRTACAECGLPMRPSGLTGYRNEAIVCDRCLTRGCVGLGMILGLEALARAFSRTSHDAAVHRAMAAAELATYSRTYERAAARWGPPRAFDDLFEPPRS